MNYRQELIDCAKYEERPTYELELYQALYNAHYKAADRQNASSQVLQGAWSTNNYNLINSIIAALSTIGGAHAPIKNTFKIINVYYYYSDIISNNEAEELKRAIYPELIIVNNKLRMPGLGSAFYKNTPDPLLSELSSLIDEKYSKFLKFIINYITELCSLKEVRLYPNLAFYTAAIARELGLTYYNCEKIMIEARVAAWLNKLK